MSRTFLRGETVLYRVQCRVLFRDLVLQRVSLGAASVSYTHLDVYKRQVLKHRTKSFKMLHSVINVVCLCKLWILGRLQEKIHISKERVNGVTTRRLHGENELRGNILLTTSIKVLDVWGVVLVLFESQFVFYKVPRRGSFAASK